MKLPFESIHIAGTNGKGSTAAYTGNIIQAAGYTCGVYTSPHVMNPTERISVDGVNIPEEEMAKLLEKYSSGATFFHAYTGAALDWFTKNRVDYAVIETGLGGRLDPTNEILSKVCILTSIGLDHMEILGNDTAKIAEEKCGIIKTGMHVVTGRQTPEVMEVIKSACEEKNCSLTVVSDIQVRNQSIKKQQFDLRCLGKTLEGLEICLPGVHQPQNASLAAAACILCGFSEEAIRKGLADTRVISRFEYFPGKPDIVLDGAHNIDSAAELKDTLKKYFNNREIILLTAVMADKDIESIFKTFASFAKEAITVKADRNRGAGAEILAEILRKNGVNAIPVPDAREAYIKAADLARERNALLVVSGSFYLTGAVRRLITGA